MIDEYELLLKNV